MARPHSIANAGYVPAPDAVMAPIARLLTVNTEREQVWVDVCGGRGEAVLRLMETIHGVAKQPNNTLAAAQLFGAEMERERGEAFEAAARKRLPYWNVRITKGDAFGVCWNLGSRQGASILWLNPPYSNDAKTRRLEQRWLERWTQALCPGVGVLLFLVPLKALEASAAFIAQHYEAPACFKLPEPYFSELGGGKHAYRQIVLVAKRRAAPLPSPDPETTTLISGWAKTDAIVPVLPLDGPAVVTVDGFEESCGGFDKWEQQPLDVMALVEKWQPWHVQERGGRCVPMTGIMPRDPFSTLVNRQFPVAVPPKPAHLAAGIASGVLSGARVTPTDPASGLPDLLLRGVFWKTFVQTDVRTNNDGEDVGAYAAERPTLSINVLDLRAGTYHELKPSTEYSGATTIAEFTVGDLLAAYGRSMLEALVRQCPPVHDTRGEPDRSLLPPTARTLYRAQAHAAIALWKLITGPDAAAVFLGEVGVGKSTTSITAMVMAGCRTILIFCPPHLVGRVGNPASADPDEREHKGWPAQILACFPDAKVVAVRDLEDVDAIHAQRGDGRLTFAVLAETTAKLSHERVGIGEPCPSSGQAPMFATTEVDRHRQAFLTPFARRHSPLACPRCGRPVDPQRVGDLAKKRVLCGGPLTRGEPRRGRLVGPSNEVGRICSELTLMLVRCRPVSKWAGQFHAGRMTQRILASRREVAKNHPESLALIWNEIRGGRVLRDLAERTARALAETFEQSGGWYRKNDVNPPALLRAALVRLLLAIGDDEFTGAIAVWLYGEAMRLGGSGREAARGLVTIMSPGSEPQKRAVATLRAFADETDQPRYGYGSTPWRDLASNIEQIAEGKRVYIDHNDAAISCVDGRVCIGDLQAGSTLLIESAVEKLAPLARRYAEPPCAEPLYQAIPAPRRIPIATYIARNFPDTFDGFIVDEAHEIKDGNSAKSHAAQRLMQLKKPTIAMTGTVMNGYSSSLFVMLWHLSSAFRSEFDRNDVTEYVRVYGYEKVYLDFDSGVTIADLSYGTMTDRVEGVRRVGEVPGVMPVLLMRHLLPMAVTLQLSDLDVELPPCETIPTPVVLAGDSPLRERYVELDRQLRDQIKKDRYSKDGLAGRLFGQLSEMGSYLDRATADTGNTPDGDYVVAYPEDTPLVGGHVVHRVEALPASVVLPKERAMLDLLRSELAEGRNVLVLVQHENVRPRLKRLIEHELGEAVVILDSKKVDTKKREAWIDKHVTGKGVRILIANPVTVQTGLNNLVQRHAGPGTGFATQIWMEDPESNPLVYRQTIGRSRRLGQALPVQIYVLYYAGTIQEIAYRLLLLKVGYAEAADGLDPDAAFRASGVGTDALAGRNLGKVLFELLEDSAVHLPQIETRAVAQKPVVKAWAKAAAGVARPAVAPASIYAMMGLS